MRAGLSIPAVDRVRVGAYTIPTERPESDATLEWDRTTVVVVHVEAGGETGLGMTYADHATAVVVKEHLAAVVEGSDAMDVSGTWWRMQRRVRNVGRSGIAMMAISALDIALWDVKARLLGVSLVSLLGRVQESVPLYLSGGFTSMDADELRRRFTRGASDGMTRFKMKVGRDQREDPGRVRAAREAIGPAAELYVDANGVYARKEALHAAEEFVIAGEISWFEEPVSSDDVEGLRHLCERAPPRVEIAAGEYAYVPADFLRLLEPRAVDVIQADVTRCGGISGFLAASSLAQACRVPVSTHTAPAISATALCAAHGVRALEYFEDHARIEAMLFDGLPAVRGELGGSVWPDPSVPGHGLTFKEGDARPYRVA